MELLRKKRLLLAILAPTLLMSPVTAVPPLQPSEYALKSVFLFQFCRFMEWPDTAFSSPDQPLTIGIIGEDPFGPLLREAIAGEKYHDRPIQVEHYRTARDIRRCQLLFVSRSESGRTPEIVASVSGSSVVTIGETPQFIEQGGMIALTADRSHVKLVMNLPVLRSTNVQVSSKLLRIADTKF